MNETVKHTPDICNRLRGIYRIPITDGLGATGGGEEPDNPDEFVRRFPAVPIQERAADLIEELLFALRRADQFITNGIELGYIQMPEADTPDPAHETPGIVRAAIAKATGGSNA